MALHPTPYTLYPLYSLCSMPFARGHSTGAEVADPFQGERVGGQTEQKGQKIGPDQEGKQNSPLPSELAPEKGGPESPFNAKLKEFPE